MTIEPDMTPSNDAGPEKAPETARRGIGLLFDDGNASYERLPMLDVVFDRLTRQLTTSMRAVANDNVSVTLDRLASSRFGDVVAEFPENGMFAVFKAAEWENFGLIILDWRLIYIMIDALLGGSGRDMGQDLSRRRHTTLDRALIEPLIHTILADLSRAFGPLCAVTFRFERLEMNDRFVSIARMTDGAVSAAFSVAIGERTGRMAIVLPHATLEPIRDVLLQQFMGEKFGHDATWEQHLAHVLWKTDLELDVVIEEAGVRLGDILDLKPGEQLVLKHGSTASALLRCGEHPLYEGRIGQFRNRMAFKIADRVDDPAVVDDLDAELQLMEPDNG